MHTVETVLLVLMLGALTGVASRYIRTIPLPLIQILLGAALSWPRQGLHIVFDPDLFLLLFIPPLLFADGWRIPKREFFALYRPILKLAFGLVLFTVVGLGYLIHWLIPEMPLTVAFALAAVVSPTDAVAVSAITRNLGMPSQTMRVLEGESLLNDASGLVALKFAIAATLTGLFSWTHVARDFIWIAFGGIGAGALIGWGFSVARDAVTRRLGDVAATQMALLLVLLPFAAYIVGDRLGVSGILAAVAAGVMTNFADLDRSEFVAERMQTEGTWTMVESAFNGAIFLLLGLQLPSIIGTPLREAGHQWWILAGYALAISSALLLLRWIWLTLGVQGSLWRAHAEGKLVEKPSYLLTLASTLAGIRGAVTLAGALSLPLLLNDGAPFPARDLLIFLATGTILFTLVIGTIGLPLVLKRMPPGGEPASAREERRARVAACKAAIASMVLGKEQAESVDPQWLAQYQESAGRLTQEYRKRIDLLEDPAPPATPEALAEAPDVVRQRRHRYVVELELRLKSLHVERNALYAERHEQRINDESLRSLVAELDLAEASLRKRLDVARRAAGLTGAHDSVKQDT
ncbi:Na+/H+ antiporter [Paraburkholderia xenovorans LB400]|jgi:monovalent cation/hydrogen antiporter|uniref:Sodium/proton antiporter, CPA1 family n=1 Tax=Paraburkholderia xenovorans (strain LB400) TaxID=266265 RepID=Q13N91_PARXL|nr:Na+/H+ antiporter [Paraburkholderia xenovorans]ABE34448.1 sodium/proton antiporter, CPA1 family [Paraburkholderia xenovorans LB400]AIP36310.1 Na+/H+ antiporter [Paraburkholderia xenovorans LB400]NPT33248.1 Na+/H+ antiporter [Paraburkholderia xenovorans]